MLDIEEVENLSHRVIAEWMAYASVEPFGEERADLRAGIIASVIANCHRDTKRRPVPFTPRDFMPAFGGDAEQRRPDRVISRQLRAAFAQRFKRKQAPRG